MAETSSALTLREELQETRKAVYDLAEAVHELAQKNRTQKWVIVALAALLALVIGLGVWEWFESQKTDDDLRNLGRDLFISSCESTNAGRQLGRDNNIEDAELLIRITGADVESPEIADEYRRLVREQNARIVDRDCVGEFEQISRSD